MTREDLYTARKLLERYRSFGFDLSAPGTWRTLEQVKRANAASGYSWFSREAMDFFGTWNVKLRGGCLLSFSDRNFDDTGREHKVAFIERDGGVATVIDPKFDSASERDEFLAALLALLEDNRE